MVILTASAQVIEHVVVRGFLYTVEGAANLAWYGAKWVYGRTVGTANTESTDDSGDEAELKALRAEIADLRQHIAVVEKQISQQKGEEPKAS